MFVDPKLSWSRTRWLFSAEPRSIADQFQCRLVAWRVCLAVLVCLDGLGWMQMGLRTQTGYGDIPTKFPNELKVLEYTADELMHLHQVTINGMLFHSGCWKWNKHSANKSKFCFTMKQLIGTHQPRMCLSVLHRKGKKYVSRLVQTAISTVKFERAHRCTPPTYRKSRTATDWRVCKGTLRHGSQCNTPTPRLNRLWEAEILHGRFHPIQFMRIRTSITMEKRAPPFLLRPKTCISLQGDLFLTTPSCTPSTIRFLISTRPPKKSYAFQPSYRPYPLRPIPKMDALASGIKCFATAPQIMLNGHEHG